MGEYIYHIECKRCGKWKEVRENEKYACPTCGEDLTGATERQKLLSQIKYYALEYTNRRRQAITVIKLSLLIVLVIGLATFYWPQARIPFFVATALYGTFLVSLFTRPSYVLDMQFYDIWHNRKDEQLVKSRLGTMTYAMMSAHPYPHIYERIITVRRLRNYMAEHERID